MLDSRDHDAEPTFEPILDAWYLTGPTASGKSKVGLELATLLDAEIISLDSMALYQGMDIGTAKPSAADRARIPHHLLDLRPPGEDFSLANYVEAAAQAVAEIRGRGRAVLFVGGTPLYLKALLRGVFRGPPADWEFRDQIEREIAQVGLAALHQRLELLDPLSAARLHPHDKRRIIRALEVHRLTGQPISHLQIQFDEANPPAACRVYALEWPRPLLHARIEARVEQMFAQGLVDEVRGLIARYGSLSRTASQAVGYREVLTHLDGAQNLATTIEMVKARTRQFARRQETWFRSLVECRRLPMREGVEPAEIAREIVRLAESPPEFDR